ncbi:MAG: hypothetical protein H7Z71_01840 [Moraxellaceae bacterium]|nr:hypothetical protein [Pseudobdellovibrionaceae bacterium]
MIFSKISLVSIFLLSTLVLSCGKLAEDNYTIDTNEEMAQQIGDALVSIDESGGKSDGSIAKFNPTGYEKAFARLKPKGMNISDLLIPKSFAATCSATPFSCNPGTGVATRSFTDCTLAGGGTTTGSVTLTFTGTGLSSCTIPMANDKVTRSPNYQIAGFRGAVFKVSAVSTGQSLTRVNATSFNFSSTGIRRTFTTSSDKVVLDMTSLTTGPISVTGATRGLPRTLNSGSLMIIDNLTSISCTMSHTNVAWGSTCNCPISGSWAGGCTDGTALQVVYGSTCGQAVVTKGSVMKTITMDRCQP